MLSKQQVRILIEWVDLDFDVKVSHLRSIAQKAGFDRGWAERNVRNVDAFIKKLPSDREVSEKEIELKAAFLPPPSKT